MNRRVLPLILLVCCAHGLVHTYELAFPSVEQQMAAEFHPDDPEAGKQLSGMLSNTWRFFWGIGAIFAGYLVDRVGASRMLIIYLLGCSLMCMATGVSQQLPLLITSMLMMGVFASIYHPAGLDMISGLTDRATRPRALGLHGIFGSLGIACAPFLAWILLSNGLNWRQYFLLLALPGFLIAMLLTISARKNYANADSVHSAFATKNVALADDGQSNWPAFWVLTVVAMLQGFVYSAQMSFLPRYLSDSSSLLTGNIATYNPLHGKMLAAGALLLGCIGQYLAGRFAKADRLERQLMLITFFNVPFLIWMAVATEWQRFIAAGSFCIVHFMHQPIYNSLIPKYAPARQRSLCFGISFAMAFGFGSFGASFAGATLNDTIVYLTLAGVALVAGIVGLILTIMNRNANRVPH